MTLTTSFTSTRTSDPPLLYSVPERPKPRHSGAICAHGSVQVQVDRTPRTAICAHSLTEECLLLSGWPTRGDIRALLPPG